MKVLAILSVFLLVGSLSNVALAEEAAAPKAKPARPCMEDIKKLCPEVKVGKGRIRDCLFANVGSLTNSECKAKIEEAKKGYDACQADKKALCPDKEKGKGLMACMKENEAKVSADCKAFVAKRKEVKGKIKEKVGKGKKKGAEKSEGSADESEEF